MVFCSFPFICQGQVFFPWQRELPNNAIFSAVQIQNQIWSECCLSYGNGELFLKSTINCQSTATESGQSWFLCLFSFGPSLMKGIKVNLSLSVVIYYPLSLHWPQSLLNLRDWLWCQRYRPSLKSLEKLLRISCKVACLPHNWQLGVLVLLHMYRFVGWGKMSYTDWIRSLTSLKSASQQYFTWEQYQNRK